MHIINTTATDVPNTSILYDYRTDNCANENVESHSRFRPVSARPETGMSPRKCRVHFMIYIINTIKAGTSIDGFKS